MARGIRASLVVPSLVDTPLGREASRLNPGRTARSLPFGRQATAWEVAYATVRLLSEESSYVNAHPLVLDGGATSFGLSPWRCVASATAAAPARPRQRGWPARSHAVAKAVGRQRLASGNGPAEDHCPPNRAGRGAGQCHSRRDRH